MLTGILLGEALHNGAGAKGGGGDEATEQRRRVGRQVKIGDHPFQTLVGIRRAAAVEPVEHHRQVIEGRLLAQASVSAGSNCFWLALICSRNAGCC